MEPLEKTSRQRECLLSQVHHLLPAVARAFFQVVPDGVENEEQTKIDETVQTVSIVEIIELTVLAQVDLVQHIHKHQMYHPAVFLLIFDLFRRLLFDNCESPADGLLPVPKLLLLVSV